MKSQDKTGKIVTFCNNNPVLDLQHVHVAFQEQQEVRVVLSDINLQIQAGEWITVVGKNGSGKSTLARVMAGMLPVSKGTVTGHTSEHWIQMVFQNPEAQIVGETIYEDVCFGMENASVPYEVMQERARDVLLQVGLTLPLDFPTAHLSGGQKQLLAIAGCLAMEAEVILFDESTSMLDPLSRKLVSECASHLHRQGKTIVWITQWMEEAARSKRLIALERGSIVFDGTPQRFFYGDVVDGDWSRSMSDTLSLVPPYCVRVGKQLLRNGWKLDPLPLDSESLGRAVNGFVLASKTSMCEVSR